jgi:LCP family protein required for cell wall assembly
MNHTPGESPKSKSTPAINWLIIGLAVAFVITAGITAFLTYIAVRDIVLTWKMPGLSGIAVEQTEPALPAEIEEPATFVQTPLQPSGGPAPEPWDGASRVNVLIMGLDYRDWESSGGAPRADVMMVLSLDPVNQTAAILSIPPNLWVSIPGFSHNLINSAYSLGEVNQVLGGGPQLAINTVEGLLGLDIQYYLQLDFTAFERFIDEIGGVKIDVLEPLKISPLGLNPHKVLQPGVQVLPADLALAYARAGDTKGGVFDSAQRQQQVIMAIRNRLLHHDTLLTLISKAPTLFNELSEGVHTNLTLEQVVQLSWFAAQIPEGNIKRGTIGTEQVAFGTTADGQQVLKPIPLSIRMLRDELFSAYGAANPAMAGSDPKEMMMAEGAKVAVFNGTSTPGLAASAVNSLESEGVNIVQAGNAGNLHTMTTITDHTGNPHTLRFLVDQLGISAHQIIHAYEPYSEVDVVIVLGNDWGQNY